jgi:type IV pilus assembly protein PilC
MAQNFIYKAKGQTGQAVSGTILAEDKLAVAAFVQKMGYFVTAIEPANANDILSAGKNYLAARRKVSVKDIALLCRKFSTMIDVGLPIITCLNILIKQTAHTRLKAALQDIQKRVQEGQTLSFAMGLHAQIFPTLMLSMIEAGEVGGVLDDVLNRLAIHMEKEYKMAGKIKAALTYPAFIIVISILSVLAILILVMPTFLQLFANMKVELPLPTRILLGISNFLRTQGILLLFGLLGLMIGGRTFMKKRVVQLAIDTYIVRLPIIGTIFEKIAVARFSRTLSALIRSGVPLLAALDVVKKTVGNLMMIDVLTLTQSNIKEGVSLATTLEKSNIFDVMVIEMVAIGEESGSLDQMLAKIADFYESEVDDLVASLSSLLEPVIIVVLGIIVAFIAMSILLPLFGIFTGAGQIL